MLHAYGQIGSQLLSEAPPTSYWHAYYWLHLHMRWCMTEIEKSMDDGCYSDLVELIFTYKWKCLVIVIIVRTFL